MLEVGAMSSLLFFFVCFVEQAGTSCFVELERDNLMELKKLMELKS